MNVTSSGGRNGSLGVAEDEVALAEDAHELDPRLCCGLACRAVRPEAAGRERGEDRAVAGRAPSEDTGDDHRRRGKHGRARAPANHPGGQSERPATHEVDVQVIDRLAAPTPDVRGQSIAIFGDPLGPREVRGHREHATEERAVGVGQLQGRADVPARDEQDVGRGSRSDVADREDLVVLVQPGGRQLVGHDPAEQARGGGHQGSFAPQNEGFVLMRKPITPTSAAIR